MQFLCLGGAVRGSSLHPSDASLCRVFMPSLPLIVDWTFTLAAPPLFRTGPDR